MMTRKYFLHATFIGGLLTALGVQAKEKVPTFGEGEEYEALRHIESNSKNRVGKFEGLRKLNEGTLSLSVNGKEIAKLHSNIYVVSQNISVLEEGNPRNYFCGPTMLKIRKVGDNSVSYFEIGEISMRIVD